ncbi:hypothetical protein ART_2355 [Arthrobacter sp. PAMC 25486]|uniref:PLD nuclease N-terminal domain-containing protein n=1 Tax=Arthrobacter sp. PAMC 25486 TaxID=1494608 RepID=UPI00053633DF|nr:PLD nuclease N-terminal domain-containing protein [Arthrobacter sp. PAMC 25486]AIY01954.1 hypothetical protein ART_2355 [Arthrobacter sp. PAMC 25486]
MRYIIPVALGIVIFVYGLIDCLRSETNDVRSIPKSAWILVIVLLNVIGVALWFLFGRPQYAASGAGSSVGQRTGGPSSGPNRTAAPGSYARSTAPDDDPQFLRNLEVNRTQKMEAERLRKLKAELEAREAKLREQHPNDENKK